MSGAETLPSHGVQTDKNRAAPTGRGRICGVMSLFGEDESVGGRGLDESSGSGGGNARSPTEMLESITEEQRQLFTRIHF